MKNLKSINYWSYPGGFSGELSIEKFFKISSQHKYEGVEVCIGETGALSLESTEEECLKILELAKQSGIQVVSVASGIYWSYNLASEREEDRIKAVDSLEKMIQITHWLKCRTLLTIPGAVDVFFLPNRPVQNYQDVLKFATDGLRKVLPTAERLGVCLAIENVWNKFILSPSEMVHFVDSFESPAIGVYVDVANILPYGYPEQFLRILGSRVKGVHFKDFRRAVGTGEGFVDLLEGDVNWPEVIKAIEEIDYTGAVVAELIPLYTHHPEARGAVTSIAMDYILGRKNSEL